MFNGILEKIFWKDLNEIKPPFPEEIQETRKGSSLM